MEETTICRLCLEPIYNFICPDCLHSSISQWLHSNGICLEKFHLFHKNLKEHFATDENKEFCIKCKNITETSICVYCYAKEVFWWIFEKNVKLAQNFAKLFNYDFMGVGFLPTVKPRNLTPPLIIFKESEIDFNICENCGQVSDNLKEENGSWLCEVCREG